MATIQILPTNFKDDIFASGTTTRKYNMTENQDNTVSFEDVTDYRQNGSNFGAGEHNATNAKINEIINLINGGQIGSDGLAYLASKRISKTNSGLSIAWNGQMNYDFDLGLDFPTDIPNYELSKYYLYDAYVCLRVLAQGATSSNYPAVGSMGIVAGFELSSGSNDDIIGTNDNFYIPLVNDLYDGSSVGYRANFKIMGIEQTAQDMHVTVKGIYSVSGSGLTINSINAYGKVIFYDGCKQG